MAAPVQLRAPRGHTGIDEALPRLSDVQCRPRLALTGSEPLRAGLCLFLPRRRGRSARTETGSVQVRAAHNWLCRCAQFRPHGRPHNPQNLQSPQTPQSSDPTVLRPYSPQTPYSSDPTVLRLYSPHTPQFSYPHSPQTPQSSYPTAFRLHSPQTPQSSKPTASKGRGAFGSVVWLICSTRHCCLASAHFSMPVNGNAASLLSRARKLMTGPRCTAPAFGDLDLTAPEGP